jgi:hypothetical protein
VTSIQVLSAHQHHNRRSSRSPIALLDSTHPSTLPSPVCMRHPSTLPHGPHAPPHRRPLSVTAALHLPHASPACGDCCEFGARSGSGRVSPEFACHRRCRRHCGHGGLLVGPDLTWSGNQLWIASAVSRDDAGRPVPLAVGTSGARSIRDVVSATAIAIAVPRERYGDAEAS